MISSVTVSLVSHGHGLMVENLIHQLKNFPEISRVILTINVPEDLNLQNDGYLYIIYNNHSKGFGSNHNFAYQFCVTKYFCVLNPDIIFSKNIFKELIEAACINNAGLTAPLVLDLDGVEEDSARYFPTLGSLFLRIIGCNNGRFSDTTNSYLYHPDWIAGMFMLFDSKIYSDINGFDDRFFLYCEDIDICARLWIGRHSITINSAVNVIHNARRASRRNLRYAYWHILSLLRYFYKYGLNFKKIKLN